MSKSSKSRTIKEHENKHSKGKSNTYTKGGREAWSIPQYDQNMLRAQRAIPSSGRGKILDTKPKRKVMEAKLGK